MVSFVQTVWNFWTWLILHRLFIMDGVISIPIALAGYYFLPDVPEISRARYFTEQVSQCIFPEVIFGLRLAGTRVCKEAHETGRTPKQRAVHQSKVREDFLFMAHLWSDAPLRVR